MVTPAGTPDDEHAPASRRLASVVDFKRDLIRDAARQVFAEVGLADASVRKITALAGYSTSALYTYYRNKEELYADVLRSSMDDVLVELQAAVPRRGKQARPLLARVLSFYLDRPLDFDLIFHLYRGAHPRSLGKELNRELNAQMTGVFDFIATGYEADGAPQPREQAIAAVTFVFGLILMANTGRLTILAVSPERLLDVYLAER